MKASLLLTAGILAAFAFYGWNGQRRITATRLEYERLSAEASALGYEPSRLLEDDAVAQLTRHHREAAPDREATARACAASFIAFVQEMKAAEAEGTTPDGLQSRALEMINGISLLDPAQIRLLVAELRNSSALDDKMRNEAMSFAVMILSGQHPSTALSLLSESDDLVADKGLKSQIISSALGSLAKDDPMAAIEWLRQAKNTEGLIQGSTRMSILTGAAAKDPKLALSLIGDLQLKGSEREAVSIIANSAGNPESRTNTLAAVREFLEKHPDPEARKEIETAAMAGFARAAMLNGYDSAATWVQSAGLSEQELAAFASNVELSQNDGDTGKWIAWLDGKMPQEEMLSKVRSLVRNWTINDYKTAASWINDSADGPVKQAAIQSYARALIPYEPEAAAQWAESLSSGNQRAALLQDVYNQWKTKDAAAASAYAKKHGLKETE